jgi:tRNA G37 N-methylase Trm5
MNSFRIVIAATLALAAAQAWAQPAERLRQRYRQESLAPYVPSPQAVVDKMLEVAEPKAGEVLYDLGCGDGRIPITAARQFKASGVCVELSEDLAARARENIKQHGLEGSVTVIHGNLLEVDLKPADIVTLYLLTSSNERLRPTLEKSLKPGARVISHDFQMRGWKPNRIDTVDATGRTHTIYVYRMPPTKD